MAPANGSFPLPNGFDMGTGCHLLIPVLAGLTTCAVLAGCSPQPAEVQNYSKGIHWDGGKGVLSYRRGSRLATMKFIRVPAGPFRMGRVDQPRTILLEGPVRSERVQRGFWIGATEVTREQWHAFSGADRPADPDLPMTRVSWNDIQRFMQLLATSGGPTFRLPTEVEWEYACRGRSSASGGDTEDLQLTDYGWYAGNATGRLHPVGHLEPNALGLHDMHGNAAEWTQDASTTGNRVLRGGTVLSAADEADCGCRYHYPPDYGYHLAGFRLAAD